MKETVFLVNSVYQVFVAMWMKNTVFKETISDIVVSDHMNGGEEIYVRLRKQNVFRQCFFIKSRAYCHYELKETSMQHKKTQLAPLVKLKEFCDISNNYDQIIAANLDRFFVLFFSAMERKNPQIEICLFEDGLSSYSKLFEKFFEVIRPPINKRGNFREFIYKYIYRKKYSSDYIKKMYVFNPDLMDWDTPFPVIEIPKISTKDRTFRELCNSVFLYDGVDTYGEKYLFMEEAFFADGAEINDVELLKEIAKQLGKENIMVKIHPRNSINRFAELGYKTNMNTSIPWEVILMNLDDISEKVLITIASTSVLNPILVFGQQVKVFSLFDLVDKEKMKKTVLSGALGQYTLSLLEKLSDRGVCVCKSLDDIE